MEFVFVCYKIEIGGGKGRGEITSFRQMCVSSVIPINFFWKLLFHTRCRLIMFTRHGVGDTSDISYSRLSHAHDRSRQPSNTINGIPGPVYDDRFFPFFRRRDRSLLRCTYDYVSSELAAKLAQLGNITDWLIVDLLGADCRGR